jgi:hypothetical protein
MTGNTLSNTPETSGDWLEQLYARKEAEGFEVFELMLQPQRPSRRINETWGEVYEYDSELLPYPTREAEALAAEYELRISALRAELGDDNVFELPVGQTSDEDLLEMEDVLGLHTMTPPTEEVPMAPRYPAREYRVIMIRPAGEPGQSEAA